MTALTEQRKLIETLSGQLSQMATAITTLSGTNAITAELNRVDRVLSDLKVERNHCETILINTIPDDLRQKTLARLNDMEAKISQYEAQSDQLAKNHAALQFHLNTAIQYGHR